MKKITPNLITILLVVTLAFVTDAATKDKRITLKNGKSKESVTLNPSRTYRFLINAKEFSKLSIALQNKGGKIRVMIKAPNGKIISSGTGKNYTIRKGEMIEKGDYQIILKNIGKNLASVGIKVGDIKGESK